MKYHTTYNNNKTVYLGMHLRKDVQELYVENYKIYFLSEKDPSK